MCAHRLRGVTMTAPASQPARRLRFEPSALIYLLLLLIVMAPPGTSPSRLSRTNVFLNHVPAPEFLPGTHNVTVRPGDAALLPCSVRHLGTKKVVWRNVQEDRFLTIGVTTWSEDSNISLDFSRKPDDVTNWDLVILHVRQRDAGVYECQITSQASKIRKVMLNVVGTPISKPVISITGKKYVNLGERLELVCNATGGPRIPDEIDWFKTGNKIDSDKPQYRHAVITKFQSISDRSFISKLIIKHAALHDTGDYICRSSRNDIANLKVTVLHTETDNKRRESSKQWDHTDAAGSSSGSSAPAPRPPPLHALLLLQILLLAVLRAPFTAIVVPRHS